MLVSGLVIQTSSRSTGYISRKSKQARLDKLVSEGLIKDFKMRTSIVFECQVDPDNLRDVEQQFKSAHIAYRKGS